MKLKIEKIESLIVKTSKGLLKIEDNYNKINKKDCFKILLNGQIIYENDYNYHIKGE